MKENSITGRFKKEERLSGKKIIAELMRSGISLKEKKNELFPFRVLWLPVELSQKFPVQVLFSVPKKKIKEAVLRNRIKRKMGEAFRQNKQVLYQPLIESGKRISLAIIYLPTQELSNQKIRSEIILTLHRLAEEVALKKQP